MSSLQAPGGSSKAAKFQAANPLAPMADPFSGVSDEQKDYHRALSESVNQRLARAVEDLKDKHARGVQERDHPDRAPTGRPYRQAQMEKAEQHQQAAKARESEREKQVQRIQELRDQVQRQTKNDDDDASNSSSSTDDDDEWLEEEDGLDSDPTLEAIRERRLAQLRQESLHRAALKARGHGDYRTISQDEFLPECCPPCNDNEINSDDDNNNKSVWVVVHFYHDDFEKCKIMDFHLQTIATNHLECKFLRLDATKAPFFVTKLKIQTLPTVIVFENGKAIDRLVGFEGLSDHTNNNSSSNNEWPTTALLQWLSKTGAIKYKTPLPSSELEEEMKRLGIATKKESVWRGGCKTYDDEDDYYQMCGR